MRWSPGPLRHLALVGWRGLVVACLGLVLTGGVWLEVRRDAQIDGRAHFDGNVARTVSQVRGRLVGHLRMMEHVSAFVGLSWPISGDRFELFTRRTQLARRYPAFHGLTFVRAVPGSDGSTRAVISRTDGYPGSLPPGTDVTVMMRASGFVMPTARRPLSIIPISPTFRAFLELFTRARNLPGNPRSLGVVDTMAIRRVVTTDGRLLGWLTSPARISDALPSVGSTSDDDLGASLELLKGPGSTPVARIQGSAAGPEDSPLHRREIIDTDGVRWAVTVWENPSRIALSTKTTVAIWGAGLLLTLMAMLVVTTRASARRRLERAHAKLDAESLRARSDALTGLVNRDGLLAALRDTIARARRDGTIFGVLFIDLDGFKAINDTLGHQSGDEVLVEAAARLRRSVRSGDVVARFAGDEFVVICERLERAGDAEIVATKLAATLRQPFELDSGPCDIAGSVGIAVSAPPHEVDERTLLRDADAAMYEAKRSGLGVVPYADGLAIRARARAGGALQLRQAIERGEIVAHYQPILDGREIVAVEALARWQHPERGLLSPAAFLEDARDAGLLGPLGDTMLRQACAQVAAWNAAAGRGLRVQVNVAEQQLIDPMFPRRVAAILAETGLAPTLLTLEITEDVAIEHLGPDLAVLRRLHELGVGLAVDDFGLGRSTFAALRALDMVSELKIDRSFVSGIDASSTDQALVRAMVSLAGEVGLHIVAEGVETPAELDELTRLGIHSVQGFHLARPAAAADVERLLAPRREAA